MEKKMKKNSYPVWVLKALLMSYAVTSVFLVILAFLLYRFHLSEEIVTGAIIVIYVVSTFIGGFVLGKMTKVHKFLWGLVIGVLYFSLLLLITIGVYHTLEGNGTNAVTTFLLCAGGGMIGGMLS
ncbi:MAG: TIGR04086 family membrane protein [Hespellia sp.]|nr:TIGR04086 family membrane protein [Hespellia sp.]